MNVNIRSLFKQLLVKYNRGKANSKEIAFLEAFDNLFELVDDAITDDNEAANAHLKLIIKNRIDHDISNYEVKGRILRLCLLWVKRVAAVLTVFLLSFTIYTVLKKKDDATRLTAQQINDQIIPGTNKAVLILANGKSIVLDNTKKGEIARQNGVIIHKTADGKVLYQMDNKSTQHDPSNAKNIIATPNGGQYNVTLPDGTKVWLNAASRLSYPTVFSGSNRLVELVGEAYFEVSKNPAMPFKVISAGQVVEVLGTHFNINSYEDEPGVETTLLEGSVKISSAGHSLLIKPGEQAVISANQKGEIRSRKVDAEQEIAWKNGIFSFHGQDIKSIMRQVSRWYNIDVSYGARIPKEKYYGELSRGSSLQDVFRILELNNVKFTIQGRLVTVAEK